MIDMPQKLPDVGKRGCEKATTRMGKMIEKIWIRKTSVGS